MSLERLLQQLSDPSDLSWKDETYDLMDAKALSSADRAVYVAQLIEHAEKGDALAIMTLGHLRANEALPTLEAAAKSGNAWAPSARRALVLLGKGATVLAQIADDAVHAPSKMQRVAAILDLPKIGGPVAIAALEQALLDAENDVRGIAWDALVDALGLAKRIENPEGAREITTDIEVMRVLLGSQIPALVKIGASGMQSVVRRLATGTTPQQLGIAWRPRTAEDVFENLRESMYEDVPYKIEELSTLKGAERFLAETMIVLRLQHGDERVPDALVKLGAAWTVPALEELAKSEATPSELQTKLAEAARVLAATTSLN
jgi:HEAT repeat protein